MIDLATVIMWGATLLVGWYAVVLVCDTWKGRS